MLRKKVVTLDSESVIAELYDTSIRTWSANRSRPSDRTGATNRTWPTTGSGPSSGPCPAARSCSTEVTKASAQARQKGPGSAKGSEKAPKTLIQCLELEPLCSNSDE